VALGHSLYEGHRGQATTRGAGLSSPMSGDNSAVRRAGNGVVTRCTSSTPVEFPGVAGNRADQPRNQAQPGHCESGVTGRRRVYVVRGPVLRSGRRGEPSASILPRHLPHHPPTRPTPLSGPLSRGMRRWSASVGGLGVSRRSPGRAWSRSPA
jgi:hypothetical protein